MKTGKWLMITAALILISTPLFYLLRNEDSQTVYAAPAEGCVFMTVFGEESSDSFSAFKTPEKVVKSLNHGLEWIVQAQHNSGGWGAGSQSRQDIRDPHAVPADPATTSMVGMALIRNGNSLTAGKYSSQLKNALNFILNAVEKTPANQVNITSLTGTQIQGKLGANIDVILSAQFLSNISEQAAHDPKLSNRILTALNSCVSRIQKAQDTNGSVKGAGWAGVLQSSLASNALESAAYSGADVDKDALKRSRDYQMSNMNVETGDVNTEMGAGIVLYSVSGSGRAAASEARQVEEKMNKAKEEGKISGSAPVTTENLQKLGYTKDEAIQLTTSYKVYNAAKTKAQDERVMTGFGNNGGEEFLSYLQTGEGMVINKDNSWKTWYDNMSGRLLKIQNNDGSWNGHHCITSPVFCTATCLLILSVNNDLDRLTGIGAN